MTPWAAGYWVENVSNTSIFYKPNIFFKINLVSTLVLIFFQSVNDKLLLRGQFLAKFSTLEVAVFMHTIDFAMYQNCLTYSWKLGSSVSPPCIQPGNTKRGSTIDLLFDRFGISCMTTDNFCFYLLNSLIQTSQTGGQQYSDTSPFSNAWLNSPVYYRSHPPFRTSWPGRPSARDRLMPEWPQPPCWTTNTTCSFPDWGMASF